MQASRPLPRFKGPKLGPFQSRNEAEREIKFLEHLGGGSHAEVFRAVIGGSVYAVKVFRFVHYTEVIQPNVLRDGKVSIHDILCQNDPFYCECRAYGRLKEVCREDLAVRCYWYLLLSQRHQEHLAKLGFADWGRRDVANDRPIRAIVKEHIPNNGAGPFTFEMLPRMRQDILELNRLGVVVWDIRADNYRAGRLIDFSQAHTAPHMELEWDSTIYDREQVMECCVRDLVLFDAMIEEWNDDHPDRRFWRRFFPSPDFAQRLRKRERHSKDFHWQEGAKFAAAFYDWKRKDGTAQPSNISKKSSSTSDSREKRVSGGAGVRKRVTSTSSGKTGKRKGKPP